MRGQKTPEVARLASAQDALAGLAARLTDPGDRERYAAVLSYVQRLPPTDEFRELVDLMGSLTLLGQHIPDAMAEFLEAFRQETKAAAECNARMDERLASLPRDIAAGVDPAAIAKKMSESFRQQIAASGLRESAALLDVAAKESRAAAGEVSATLNPATQDFKRVVATITAELAKLIADFRVVVFSPDGILSRWPTIRSGCRLRNDGLVLFKYSQVLGPLHAVNLGIHLGTSLQYSLYSEPKLALSVGSS